MKITIKGEGNAPVKSETFKAIIDRLNETFAPMGLKVRNMTCYIRFMDEFGRTVDPKYRDGSGLEWDIDIVSDETAEKSRKDRATAASEDGWTAFKEQFQRMCQPASVKKTRKSNRKKKSDTEEPAVPALPRGGSFPDPASAPEGPSGIRSSGLKPSQISHRRVFALRRTSVLFCSKNSNSANPDAQERLSQAPAFPFGCFQDLCACGAGTEEVRGSQAPPEYCSGPLSGKAWAGAPSLAGLPAENSKKESM